MSGIALRGSQCRQTDVGADTAGIRQFGQQCQQDRARSGADIGDAVPAIGVALGTPNFEGQFDHRFGIGSWHQRRGRELQWQSPEFLLPENARDWLSSEAAARKIFNPHRFARGEKPCRSRDQPGEIETERRANQHTRVEFG